ncbi:MAG TPA: hypothetical protein V6D29_05980 [Leptolyngbyaceae cyanobacterium]
MKPPFKLLLDEEEIGSLVTYGYETPWATGQLEPVQQERQQWLINICEYLDWISAIAAASEEEEDSQCNAELSRRGLTDQAVDEYYRGDWIIQLDDGTRYPVSPPRFYADGFVEWRW